jgi:hypothetical protein
MITESLARGIVRDTVRNIGRVEDLAVKRHTPPASARHSLVGAFNELTNFIADYERDRLIAQVSMHDKARSALAYLSSDISTDNGLVILMSAINAKTKRLETLCAPAFFSGHALNRTIQATGRIANPLPLGPELARHAITAADKFREGYPVESTHCDKWVCIWERSARHRMALVCVSVIPTDRMDSWARTHARVMDGLSTPGGHRAWSGKLHDLCRDHLRRQPKPPRALAGPPTTPCVFTWDGVC